MLSFVVGDQNVVPAKRPNELDTSEVAARRAFLKNCAKYAAAMPPAITMLVSAHNALGQGGGLSQACQVTCNNPSEDPLAPDCDCPESGVAGPSVPDESSSSTGDPELLNN